MPDMIPVALLVLLGAVLGGGVVMFALAQRWNRRLLLLQPNGAPPSHASEPPSRHAIPCPFAQRPVIWLAIRSRNLTAIQSALALDRVAPCSWIEGMSGDHQLFIAPPVNGWVLVAGAGLPDPSEDVDRCFRTLLELSRKLGHVQYFQADRVLHRHAWACLEAGRVVRAYAWAETTLWQQGAKTAAEIELGVKCFNYGATADDAPWSFNERVSANVEKVPLLAARWSLDPARIDPRLLARTRGIAGQPSRPN
jgi:hypothetical protein